MGEMNRCSCGALATWTVLIRPRDTPEGDTSVACDAHLARETSSTIERFRRHHEMPYRVEICHIGDQPGT